MILTKSHRLKTLFLTIPAILVYVQWCAILELIEKLFSLDHFYYHYMAGYDITLAHIFADPLLFLLLYCLGKYSKKHTFITQLTIGEGISITILCIFLPMMQEIFNMLEAHFQNIFYNIAWTLFLIALNFAGNEIIDFVLSARNDLLSTGNIKVYCEEPLTELNYMNEVDCCILFSNLIDNALEANAKVDKDRYIRLAKYHWHYQ